MALARSGDKCSQGRDVGHGSCACNWNCFNWNGKRVNLSAVRVCVCVCVQCAFLCVSVRVFLFAFNFSCATKPKLQRTLKPADAEWLKRGEGEAKGWVRRSGSGRGGQAQWAKCLLTLAVWSTLHARSLPLLLFVCSRMFASCHVAVP